MNETVQLPLFTYIDAQLSALCVFAGESATSTMKEILHKVCRADTVFPALQYDGNGELTASWYVEGSSLSIIVDQDEETIVLCTWQRSYVLWRLPGNLQEIQDCLHNLSAYVQRHNPNWQELFAS